MEDVALEQLSEFRYPLVALDHSSQSQLLVVTVQIGERSGRGAVALIDGEDSRWLAVDAFDPQSNPVHDWLPTGGLLWASDEGVVFIRDGEERALPAPVPMFAPRAGSDSIAFGVSEGQLWRANLESGEWEQVPSETQPEVGGLGNYFGAANDGTYGLSFQAKEMWRVPTTWGAPTESLPGTNVTVVGSGSSVQPPRQLGDTTYWLIDLPITEGATAGDPSSRGLVVDVSDGRRLGREEFALPEGVDPQRYSASEDGQWLAIDLVSSSDQQVVGVYLTPSDDLKAGQVLQGMTVEGWGAKDEVVIMRETETDALAVLPLPITAGISPTPLSNAATLLAADSGRVFVTSTDAPSEVLSFDQTGTLQGTLSLGSIATEITSGASVEGYLYLGLMDENASPATHSLVRWSPVQQ